MDSRTIRAALWCTLTILASVWFAACAEEEDCGVCVEEKCADLVAYCDADPDCACMVDCLGSLGIPGIGDCVERCGLDERPVAFLPVEECVAVACPDAEDECATPSDWTAPEASEGSGSAGDIGGGDEPDCAFDPDLAFDAEGDVLQLESADGAVCVRIDRANQGPGDLANTSWLLLEARVGPLGQVAHVDDTADLCWYSSHHNFRDWAHIWTGTRHHGLKLEEDGHGGPRTYELLTFEQGPLTADECAPLADGVDPIGPPISLFPVEP